MKKISLLAALITLLFITACATRKKQTTEVKPITASNSNTSSANTDKKENQSKDAEPVQKRYNPSATRINDILHTRLEVSFDWEKQRLHGKATLDIKPHFYPVNELILDAKNFDIHKLGILKNGKLQELNYKNDTTQLFINLDKVYTRNETYTIYIEYTAKPNERETGGSSAITSDKGLYFINPEGKENKHIEIWTQGETEANSCWFPTIDKPNEKMTHELLITVPDKYKTLSNGLLIKSTNNNDGTRTDHWKMSQVHAPYLVMMAIGDYSIIKDTWKRKDGKEIEVSYYVEHDYAPYARDIFGKTPKMIAYFSKLLGVEYPWEKYSQVVVRDYVSGAMENTTATIHGEFLYKTKRELLDGHNESIIAHELFHHWFGDLITCESWANLPVNESFANYSQYLWDEYEYGADVADHYAYIEMQGYLLQSKQSGYADMVRFDYKDKEEMFDAHSYNKGGRILHMLRNIIGDEAFFESLKIFLTENAYQPVEVHHLRLAFEKVTGQDLNWFFNQWFYAQGHPKFKITQEYDDVKKEITVTIEQKQNFEKVPLYIIPVEIDIYAAGEKTTHSVKLTKRLEQFTFRVSQKPDLVNFDARKILLCEKEDIKPIEQFIFQYYHAPLYLDRREAIEKCAKSSDENAVRVIIDAMADKSKHLRELAMKNLEKAMKVQTNLNTIKEKLILAAANDQEASVRSTAIAQLRKLFTKNNQEKELLTVFEKALNDSSYEVMAEGIKGIAAIDAKRGLELAKPFENEKNASIRHALFDLYAEHGNAQQHDYMIQSFKKSSGIDKLGMMGSYVNYLKKQNIDEVNKGLELLEDIARNGSPWYVKFYGYQSLSAMQAHYAKQTLELETKLESLKEESKSQDRTREIADTEKDLNIAKLMDKKIGDLIIDIKNKETDKNIKQYIK